MSFANHNILDIALSIIPPTVVQIRKALGVSVNAYAQANAAYGEWREVYGIVQPGGESNEHTHGIDFAKKHVRIWLRGVDLTGTHIQEAPDQIRYLGRIYNVISVDDWFPYDNYRMCECVEALNLGESQRGKPTTSSQTKQKPKSTPRRRKAAPSMADMTKVKAAAMPIASSNPVQEELPVNADAGVKLFPSIQEDKSSPTLPPPITKPLVKKAIIRI